MSGSCAAVWHLVAGSTGAGKTTFARELAVRIGGVRLSIDEWMNQLYWMDCLAKNDFAWAMERVQRCETQMAAVARSLSMVGVSCVLDLGFTQRAQRTAWLERARRSGVSTALHHLDIPAEIRWSRVCERNGGTSETYSFAVTREMFDGMEAMWEPVSPEELATFDAMSPRSG